MKLTGFLVAPIIFIAYLVLAMPLHSCEPDEIDDEPECDTCPLVRKPNIYIYPEEKAQLSVVLAFPMGGNIVTSVPEYGYGWNIEVDTNGLIDGTYYYLFYESVQPNIWQTEDGWIVKKGVIEAFFRNNMIAYGFKDQEIDDFINYWVSRLDEYDYYCIYPQTSELIDKVIDINFSLQPDNILRLFYLIKGHRQFPNQINTPNIESFDREGFVVTEWGVILE